MPLENHVHCLQKEWLFWFFHYTGLHRGADRTALSAEEAGRGRGTKILCQRWGDLLCQHCCWFLQLPSTILAGPICLQSEFHSNSSNLPRWNAVGFKKNKKKKITPFFVSESEIWMPDRLYRSCHSYQKPCMLKHWSGRAAWKAAFLRSWGFVSTKAEMGV